MIEFINITSTFETKENATFISSTLIEKELVACCQISGPIQSQYRWKGEIKSDSEWICQFKTHSKHVKEIIQIIKKEHSYDIPQITVTPIIDGNQEFLSWINESVSKGPLEIK